MNPIRWFVILALMAAACALEVFLAKRKSCWPGLALPALWLTYTLFTVIAAVMGYAQAYGEPLSLSFGLVWSALLSLAQTNIPTYLLLAIYFFSRSDGRRRKQMDRMQVQDL